MSAFRGMAMARQPVERVFATARDALPEVAKYLDDVERIVVVERAELPDGSVRLVNRWTARARIPAALSAVVRPEMLTWIDRATWDPHDHVCRFGIEMGFFPDRVRCTGASRYEPAMGGRGTRVSFEGELVVMATGLPGVPAFLEAAVSKGIEAFVSALIPGNLRKVVDGVVRYLDGMGPA